MHRKKVEIDRSPPSFGPSGFENCKKLTFLAARYESNHFSHCATGPSWD